MKKPAFFALILLISCIPVAGKSNHDDCSKEKIVQAERMILDNTNMDELAPGQASSLITHFIYTF